MTANTGNGPGAPSYTHHIRWPARGALALGRPPIREHNLRGCVAARVPPSARTAPGGNRDEGRAYYVATKALAPSSKGTGAVVPVTSFLSSTRPQSQQPRQLGNPVNWRANRRGERVALAAASRSSTSEATTTDASASRGRKGNAARTRNTLGAPAAGATASQAAEAGPSAPAAAMKGRRSRRAVAVAVDGATADGSDAAAAAAKSHASSSSGTAGVEEHRKGAVEASVGPSTSAGAPVKRARGRPPKATAVVPAAAAVAATAEEEEEEKKAEKKAARKAKKELSLQRAAQLVNDVKEVLETRIHTSPILMTETEMKLLAGLGPDVVDSRVRELTVCFPAHMDELLSQRACLLLKDDFATVFSRLRALQGALTPAGMVGGPSLEEVLGMLVKHDAEECGQEERVQRTRLLLETDPRVVAGQVAALVEAAATHLQAKEPEKLVKAALKERPQLLRVDCQEGQEQEEMAEVVTTMRRLNAVAPASKFAGPAAARKYSPAEVAGKLLAPWLMQGQLLIDKLAYTAHIKAEEALLGKDRHRDELELTILDHHRDPLEPPANGLPSPVDDVWKSSPTFKEFKAQRKVIQRLREQEQPRLDSWTREVP